MVEHLLEEGFGREVLSCVDEYVGTATLDEVHKRSLFGVGGGIFIRFKTLGDGIEGHDGAEVPGIDKTVDILARIVDAIERIYDVEVVISLPVTAHLAVAETYIMADVKERLACVLVEVVVAGVEVVERLLKIHQGLVIASVEERLTPTVEVIVDHRENGGAEHPLFGYKLGGIAGGNLVVGVVDKEAHLAAPFLLGKGIVGDKQRTGCLGRSAVSPGEGVVAIRGIDHTRYADVVKTPVVSLGMEIEHNLPPHGIGIVAGHTVIGNHGGILPRKFHLRLMSGTYDILAIVDDG